MLTSRLRHIMAEKKIRDISTLMKLTKLNRATLMKLYDDVDVSGIRLATIIKVCEALECELNDLIVYSLDKKAWFSTKPDSYLVFLQVFTKI